MMTSRWIYPIMGLIVNTMLGALYAISMYYPSLMIHYGLEVVAPLALAFSLATLFFAISMIPGGFLYDKYGPRVPMVLGAMWIYIGFIIGWAMTFFPDWSIAGVLWAIGPGVIAGLGNGFTYAVPGPLAAKWFPDRTGAAVGTAVAGYGLGAAFTAPLVAYLLGTIGPFQTLLTMGLVYGTVILTIGFLIKNPPPGYTPPKKSSLVNPNPHPPSASSNPKPAAAIDYTLRQALKDTRFYFLWLIYFLAAFAGLMIIGNAAPILREGGLKGGYELAFIAALIWPFIFSTSLFNAVGRPTWGMVLDKIGTWKAAMLNPLTTAIGIFILSIIYVSPWGMFGIGYLLYLCYGGVLAIMPSATAIFFGRRFLGRIYAVLFTAWGVAGLVGALSGAWIKDVTGSYLPAFYTAITLALIAAILAFVGSKLKPKPPK